LVTVSKKKLTENDLYYSAEVKEPISQETFVRVLDSPYFTTFGTTRRLYCKNSYTKTIKEDKITLQMNIVHSRETEEHERNKLIPLIEN